MRSAILAVLIITFMLAPMLYAQTGEVAATGALNLKNFNNYINSAVERDMNLVKATEDAYYDSPADKLGTGMINAATAWADIPQQIGKTTGEHNVLVGMTYGFGKGIVSGIKRGVSAAYDMSTCGLPPYDKPMVRPEFTSDNPNQDLKISVLKW
ncbi:MAG: exosortase system-associated protein, TIGR04073 family [Candidatus Omnitrophica bacterium]|nr:exosortase system-associated protein, TIGR04073 family [Candidatus Omnitrophota bacterium]